MAVIGSFTTVIDAYWQLETWVTKLALTSVPVIDIMSYMAKEIKKQIANVSTFETFSSYKRP